jgi:pyrroline-5-carboxylate reductase
MTGDFMLPGPLWLIGCGNMGGAMLEGWLSAGIDPGQISIVDPYLASPPAGVRLVGVPPEDEVPAMVLLAVKPQKLDEAVPKLAPALDPQTIIVSILAGTELASLHARFPACPRIVRAMPNTPVRLRKGAVALCGVDSDSSARARVETLMRQLGLVEWLPERLFDAVTALSGSGPAFLFRFIDALGEAGAAVGLPRDQADRLALATIEGAAALASIANEPPGALADRVASPGGSTREGLNVLDEDRKLVQLLVETLGAAVKRNQEMAAQTRDS